MSKSGDILTAAEAILYRDGFHATGVDRLVEAAGTTPRTLYRHFRSKEGLVRAVLERREARYLEHLQTARPREAGDQDRAVLALFDAHGAWLTNGGARGCMFSKAHGEYGTHDAAIADLALAHKRRVLDIMRDRVTEAGLSRTGCLAERLLLLMEGATALAPVLGAERAATQARATAGQLLAVARAEAGR